MQLTRSISSRFVAISISRWLGNRLAILNPASIDRRCPISSKESAKNLLQPQSFNANWYQRHQLSFVFHEMTEIQCQLIDTVKICCRSLHLDFKGSLRYRQQSQRSSIESRQVIPVPWVCHQVNPSHKDSLPCFVLQDTTASKSKESSKNPNARRMKVERNLSNHWAFYIELSQHSLTSTELSLSIPFRLLLTYVSRRNGPCQLASNRQDAIRCRNPENG